MLQIPAWARDNLLKAALISQQHTLTAERVREVFGVPVPPNMAVVFKDFKVRHRVRRDSTRLWNSPLYQPLAVNNSK